jgi:hypothetical protein
MRSPRRTRGCVPGRCAVRDGGDVYAEATGAWVIAGSTGEFVVRTSDQPLRLYLRNGSSPNTVSLSSGDWHDLLSFAPNESREVVVPHRSECAGSDVAAIRPSGGFRPADTDSASRDVRVLGVWVELR